MGLDLFPARHAASPQQLLRAEQHPGRTEAALQRVAAHECILQVGDLAGIRHALDGFDPAAGALHREHEAAAHRHIVEPHRAGAADALLAPHVAAGEAEPLAEKIDERDAHVHGLAHLLAVDHEGNGADVFRHGGAAPGVLLIGFSITADSGRIEPY
jgi:hypothetical protein